jgi:hypothetical protein
MTTVIHQRDRGALRLDQIVWMYGESVYWRFKRNVPGPWHYGWVSEAGAGLWRMGCWNGDTVHGPVVDPWEIEYRAYPR